MLTGVFRFETYVNGDSNLKNDTVYDWFILSSQQLIVEYFIINLIAF